MYVNSQGPVFNSDSSIFVFTWSKENVFSLEKRVQKAMSFSETLGAIWWASSRTASLTLEKAETSPDMYIEWVWSVFDVCSRLYLALRQKPGQNTKWGRLPVFLQMLLSQRKRRRQKVRKQEKFQCSNIAVLCFRLEVLGALQFGYKEWLCLFVVAVIPAPGLQHPYLHLINFNPCHLSPLPPIFTSLSFVFNSSSCESTFPESAGSREESGSWMEEVK